MPSTKDEIIEKLRDQLQSAKSGNTIAFANDSDIGNLKKKLDSLTGRKLAGSIEYLNKLINKSDNIDQKYSKIADDISAINSFYGDPNAAGHLNSDETYAFASSVVGGVKQDQRGKIFSAPSNIKRLQIFEEKSQLERQRNIVNSCLRNFIENDSILKDKDFENKFSLDFSEKLERGLNKLKYPKTLLEKIFHREGDNVADHSLHKDFIKKRNEYLAKLSSEIKGDKEGREYDKIISEFDLMIANLYAMGEIDDVSAKEISNHIRGQINKLGNDIDKTKLEKLNHELQNINQGVSAGAKGLQEKEAEMWKYRAMQMLLLMSPVGPVTFIFGPIFDWIDIFDFAGTLFQKDCSFGESVGEVMSKITTFGANDSWFDPIAKFFLDDIPLIKEPFELFTGIINSEFVGASLDLAGDFLTNSGIAALGLTALYSLWNLKSELEHHDDRKKVEDRYKKDIKQAFTRYSKEDPNFKSNIENLGNKIFDQAFIARQIKGLKKDLIEKYDAANDQEKQNLLEKYNIKNIYDKDGQSKSLEEKIRSDGLEKVLDEMLKPTKQGQYFVIDEELQKAIDANYNARIGDKGKGMAKEDIIENEKCRDQVKLVQDLLSRYKDDEGNIADIKKAQLFERSEEIKQMLENQYSNHQEIKKLTKDVFKEIKEIGIKDLENAFSKRGNLPPSTTKQISAKPLQRKIMVAC